MEGAGWDDHSLACQPATLTLTLHSPTPVYTHPPPCRYANDIADLLAPQSGAYYDVWLDGEKFYSHTMEVGPICICVWCWWGGKQNYGGV